MLLQSKRVWIFVSLGALVGCYQLGSPFLGFLSGSCALALYWYQVRLCLFRYRFWSAFLFFWGLQLLSLTWMTSIEYQGPVFLVVYVALAAGMAWQFAFLSAFVGEDTYSPVFCASLWTLLEWSRLFVFCGFPFNFLGGVLTHSVYPLQGARIAGILGLSFWVVFTNVHFVKRNFFRGIVCALIPYAVGAVVIAREQGGFPAEKVHVLLVQTGLLPEEKYVLPGRRDRHIPIEKQWEWIEKNLWDCPWQKVDMVLFPEAFIPGSLDFPILEGVSTKERLQKIADHFSAEVVAGLEAQEKGKHYNAAYHYESRQGWSRYDKKILLPMAEYCPFAFLASFSAHYGIDSFFSPGTQEGVYGKFFCSPTICYEGLFSHASRSLRRKGAKILVNIGNDGWFPYSSLGKQRFWQSKVRAVENGVPLLYVSNQGPCVGVDAMGRICPEEQRGRVHKISLPVETFRTLYTLWGDVPLLCFSAGVVVWGFWRNSSLRKKWENSRFSLFWCAKKEAPE